MSEPQEITDTLNAIERASTPARELARERIAEFRLDREKGEKPLPTTNIHDDQGARMLDLDAVLSHEHHDARLGKR